MKRQRFDRDVGDFAGGAIAIGHRAVADREIAEGKPARRARRPAAFTRRAADLPVAIAFAVGLERYRRLDQREADDVDTAPEQRQQRHLRLDALGGQHLRRCAPRGIAERDVVDHQLGLERELELGTTADRQLAPGGIAEVLLDRADQLVGVEFAQRNAGRDDHQKEQSAETREHSPEQTHAPIVARLGRAKASPPPDNAG